MDEQHEAPIPVWFWVIAVGALLWNIMGCAILLKDVFALEASIEAMSEEQREWARSTPIWIYFVFGISVGTGIAGSICLLMRNKISVPLFAVSFVAVIIQMTYTMLIAGGLKVMGPSGAVMPSIVVALALVWFLFAIFTSGKGWFAK